MRCINISLLIGGSQLLLARRLCSQTNFPTYKLNTTVCMREAREMSAMSPRPPRVHVLGLGSIGTFAAHTLAEVPAPLSPLVTLLLHRTTLVDEFIKKGSKIQLETRDGEFVDHHDNYRLEVLDNGKWHSVNKEGLVNEASQEDTIDHLIVSVKGAQTAAALRPLKSRLNASSHILFLQNGSGMVEAANEEGFYQSGDSTKLYYRRHFTWHYT